MSAFLVATPSGIRLIEYRASSTMTDSIVLFATVQPVLADAPIGE